VAPRSPERAAVFLDRDGVLVDLVPDELTGTNESPYLPRDVRLLPGVPEALRALHDAGYALVGVSNQPAAAKGNVPLEQLHAVHERTVELLAAAGVALDDWRYCFHHPEGTVRALTGPCDCRKPQPGMLLAAAEELGLDLGRSWMVGDSDTDVIAGARAGCRTALVEHPGSPHRRGGELEPTRRGADLHELVSICARNDWHVRSNSGATHGKG
jgi:D-glycero-D-manno-heptose 1,7-bisphosphate phosphatase